MSEPLQPPVPPYGQPTPQPQSAPHQPQSAPHPPQPQPAPLPPQPQSAPPPPQPYGGPQGHPPETAPYQRVGHPVGAPRPAPFPTSGPAAASRAETTARRLDPPQFSTPPLQSSASGPASGRIAFVIALIGLGMSVAPVLAFPAVIRLIGYSTPLAADAIYAFVSFLAVAASVLALTLGLFSLRRPGPRGLTGLAIGIAIAVLVGAAVSGMSTLFYMSL